MDDGAAATGIVAGVIVILAMAAMILFRLKYRLKYRSKKQGLHAGRIRRHNYADSWPTGEDYRCDPRTLSRRAKANTVCGRKVNQYAMKDLEANRPSARGEVDPWLLGSKVTLQPIEPARVNPNIQAREGDIFFAPRHGGIRGGQSWV
ncbi:hypothetical protein A1O1_04327 [Capronia coronata CBS 617.96]|uniref:Uncharacterized protein n=1 Tax=Capronia coronata CBS 617.96 TaxID=1182541 RepID=W9YEA6_9EURO|nr:uncharacterized protein A1O1_04327 [Capronia coronata CBS 617.96]EXJ91217.1 hypothetical protein A1O1_04327 [Capronia coronata CBS 617.96]